MPVITVAHSHHGARAIHWLAFFVDRCRLRRASTGLIGVVLFFRRRFLLFHAALSRRRQYRYGGYRSRLSVPG
jgi:hypothetical protein